MVKKLFLWILSVCLFVWACKDKARQTTTPSDTTATAPASAPPPKTSQAAPPSTVAPTTAAAPAPKKPANQPHAARKKPRPAPPPVAADGYIPERVDTVVKDIYDTTLKHYSWDHSVSSTLIDSFSSVFDKDICAPGDNTHPRYRKYLEAAGGQEQVVRDDLKQRLTDPAFRNPNNMRLLSILGDTGRLNDCRLEPLPVYYLTYNILQYHNDSSVTRYFNLDTATLWYRLLNGDNFIGIIGYRDGRSFAGRFRPADSLGYHRVIALHHEPIAFYTTLTSPLYRFTNSFDVFGYLDHGHLVFVMGSQGDYLRYTGTSRIPTKEFEKNYKTVLAEAWYFGGYGFPQVLTQYVGQGTQSLSDAGARPAGH